MDELPITSRDSIWRACLGPLVVAAVGVAMLIWTWQTWPDVLIDFGVQLYVPWRLNAGEVLYRDIAHYTGPMSVYYHALAFHLFGVSLRTLEYVELPTLALTALAIYYIALKISGRIGAIASAITFFTLFAFARLMPAGNYNFICPYEYEYTHGILLSFGCMIFLWKYRRNRKMWMPLIAGVLAGMVFLTRAEIFFALTGMAGVAWIMEILGRPRRAMIGIGTFMGGMILPPAISVLALSRAMPMKLAMNGTLGMWPAVFRGNVASQHFYQHSMGLDEPALNIARMLGMAIIYVAVMALAWGCGKTRKRDLRLIALVIVIAAAILIALSPMTDWILSIFRPLPIVAAVMIVVGWINRKQSPAFDLLILLGVFSFLMLAKVFFYARIEQYGCFLAMPAVMLLVIGLFGWMPNWLKSTGGHSHLYLAAIGAVWLGVIGLHLHLIAGQIGVLRTPIASGSDQFYALHRFAGVNDAVADARRMIPQDETLLCLPEGIMINYLSRRRTSTPYVNFNPPDLLLFGEDNIAAAMERSPADLVMIVHKETREFNAEFFGRDYGQKLGQWVDVNYREIGLIGNEPLVNDRQFGIRLMSPKR